LTHCKNYFAIKIIKKMTTTTQTNEKDIVGIATESAKTLATAVKAASLVDTLKGKGPFTVFAPTDAAFSSIQTDVDRLLKPENKTKLANVLNYHVVSGKLKAADLTDGQELTTVLGEKLNVSIKDKKVMVGGANVTTADVSASNGIVHVIDKVLMPKM
jgi:uncharacterized surface protein with fasciclin (FAS1) repeats